MSPRGRLQLHFNNQVHFGGPMSSPPSTPHNGHHPVRIDVHFVFSIFVHVPPQNNHVTPYHNMVASFPPNSPSLAELRQCALSDARRTPAQISCLLHRFHLRMQMSPMSPL
jgi:hypothetical protein